MATIWPASALRVDSVTKTVGAAGDFATIQGAVDWFKGKIVTGLCKIDEIDGASYDEAVVFEDLFIAKGGALVLEGDARVLAGLSYVDTSATADAVMNQAGLANGGSGICTLSTNPARDEITVAGSVANPDFSAGGDNWVAGDEILVYADDGNTYTRIIASISPGGAGNHVIGITVALPVGATLGNDSTAICLKPNRAVERTAAGPCVTIDQVKGVRLDGWFLDTAAGANCHGVHIINGGGVLFENLAIVAEDFGIFVDGFYGWARGALGADSAWGCSYGFYCTAGELMCTYATANDCSGAGFRSMEQSYTYARWCIAVNQAIYGFFAEQFANLYCRYATARQCVNTGYYANRKSLLWAQNTNALNNGNGADYNPLPGVIPGYGNGNGNSDLYAS